MIHADNKKGEVYLIYFIDIGRFGRFTIWLLHYCKEYEVAMYKQEESYYRK